MTNVRKIMCLAILAGLSVWAGSVQAASIPGSAGVTTMQDGPNVEGLYFELAINFEAFDGKDASDPLGVTPGKKQFAYILEYVNGNERASTFNVESINAVPLLETATSSTGTVNGVAAGTAEPLAHGILTYDNGNPAASFVFMDADTGAAMFGLAGARSVILAFTTSEEYGVGTVLGQCNDNSLSDAAEVSGPDKQCFGTIEGNVFCLSCGPTGQILPMAEVTVKVMSGTTEVASTITAPNGRYFVTDLALGDYTVVVVPGASNTACAVSSQSVTVTCDAPANASFCVCPTVVSPSITVKAVCNGVAVPKAWVKITGPQVHCRWAKTKTDGTASFKGEKIVPGAYTVLLKAPKGYEVNGSTIAQFTLGQGEAKEIVFNVCPIVPCTQGVCVNVVKVDNAGVETPLAGVVIGIACSNPDRRTGTTDASGGVCFDNVKVGPHSVTITVPNGYRLADGDKTVSFKLARCENKSIKFALRPVCMIVKPQLPCYWKQHASEWPCNLLWVGDDILDQTQMMNILSGKLANGGNCRGDDISLELAQYLIATKLSIAAGADIKDISPVIISADEFLLYDYPPGFGPSGKGKQLARELKNKLIDYLKIRD